MRKAMTLEGPADDAGIDLTPMLDVVFIMLVFFIVTASFIRESGLDVVPGNDSAIEVPQDGAILLRIDAANDYWLDGRRVQAGALRAYLAGLHAVDTERPVLIQPHRASSAQALVRALDAANANGIGNVTVSAAPPAGQ